MSVDGYITAGAAEVTVLAMILSPVPGLSTVAGTCWSRCSRQRVISW
jgi:hypothetical protein